MTGKLVKALPTVALVLLAGAYSVNAAHAARLVVKATVIVECTYVKEPAFELMVTAVDSFGLQVPNVQTDMTCAEAFFALYNAGFELVHSGPALRGDFDGGEGTDVAEYTVWRDTFGEPAPLP